VLPRFRYPKPVIHVGGRGVKQRGEEDNFERGPQTARGRPHVPPRVQTTNWSRRLIRGTGRAEPRDVVAVGRKFGVHAQTTKPPDKRPTRDFAASRRAGEAQRSRREAAASMVTAGSASRRCRAARVSCSRTRSLGGVIPRQYVPAWRGACGGGAEGADRGIPRWTSSRGLYRRLVSTRD